MNEILESIGGVTQIMSEITAASGEQTDGIAQINQAIAQLDEVTQQNAALVEQSASAAQSMRDKAAALSQRVAVFKLGDDPGEVSNSIVAASPAPVVRPVTPIVHGDRVAANTPVIPSRARRLVNGAPVNEDAWEQF